MCNYIQGTGTEEIFNELFSGGVTAKVAANKDSGLQLLMMTIGSEDFTLPESLRFLFLSRK